MGDLPSLRAGVGRVEAWNRRDVAPGNLRDAEFQVFSQWNEDGIIQHLIRNVPIRETTFIEFGVQDYRESNTRFLLVNDNWRGLIIDGDAAAVDKVRADAPFRKRYQLEIRCALMTRANIDQIFSDAGFCGDVGLLSVDVDGNDYWLWDAITVVSPRIVIVEFNSALGPTHALTVPYDPQFDINTAHPSLLYYGASLAALCDLGKRKGYRFIGCESHGCNAFFVRDDVGGSLPALTAEAGYVACRFCHARDEHGWIYVPELRDRLRLMADARYEDLRTGAVRTVGDIFELD